MHELKKRLRYCFIVRYAFISQGRTWIGTSPSPEKDRFGGEGHFDVFY